MSEPAQARSVLRLEAMNTARSTPWFRGPCGLPKT